VTEPIRHDVSGTAFVVNYSRSRREEISRDRYARLWVTPASIALWNELAREVYPNDDLNVSLRNRFYLGRIQDFIDENQGKKPVIINIAAGFTSYPFLSWGDAEFIEADLPGIVEYKGRIVSKWMREKKLPARPVRYIACDLLVPARREALEQELRTIIGGRPSLVILEGITYYLDRQTLVDLLTRVSRLQHPGSLIAFDYWKPDAMEYPVMVRLKDYFYRKFGERGTGWFLYDEQFFSNLSGYVFRERMDIAGLEVKYSPTRLFQGREKKIPVHFGVLERR
jgi:O-methyltransferase involved in polyketide biosynthesis